MPGLQKGKTIAATLAIIMGQGCVIPTLVIRKSAREGYSKLGLPNRRHYETHPKIHAPSKVIPATTLNILDETDCMINNQVDYLLP